MDSCFGVIGYLHVFFAVKLFKTATKCFAELISRFSSLSRFYGNTLELLIHSLLTKEYLLLLRKKMTLSIFNITKLIDFRSSYTLVNMLLFVFFLIVCSRSTSALWLPLLNLPIK